MKSERKNMGKKKNGVTMPIAPGKKEMQPSYYKLLDEIKTSIKNERLAVVVAANSSMIILYWKIGRMILEKQDKEGWGTKVIDRLSYDLKEEFQEMKGFSTRNLKYMRKFAECWTDFEFVQRVVAQIPWRSNITLMDKLDDNESRLWYAKKVIENGWSKNVLDIQISSKLLERTGNADNNFELTLPPTDSDMAINIFKDPYLFDFLGTDELRREAEL